MEVVTISITHEEPKRNNMQDKRGNTFRPSPLSFGRRHFIGAAATGAAVALLPGVSTADTLPPPLPGTSVSSTLPSKDSVVAAVNLVNGSWINQRPLPKTPTNTWDWATYFSGNIAAYRVIKNQQFLDYARAWAQQNNFALYGGDTTRTPDNQCAGQAYFDLYDIDKDKADVESIVASVTTVAKKPILNSDWTFVDQLHMAMPSFVRVANYTNDSSILDGMFSLYMNLKETQKLYDYDYGLWYRDRNYIWPTGSRSKSPNGKRVFWSRGNGWAFAAQAKVLGLLPSYDDKYKKWPDYYHNLQNMAVTLKSVQRSDGFWNANLADPNDHGGPETSGTALFAFGLAYAIRTGLIDKTTYLPVLAKAWNGMATTAVQPGGFLGYVEGSGQAPEQDNHNPVTAASTANFGVGAFLLAGAEIAKLVEPTLDQSMA
jgi:unsaturated rhamnogalacturonyl hydrolase